MRRSTVNRCHASVESKNEIFCPPIIIFIHERCDVLIIGAEAVTLQLKVSPTEEMSLKLDSPPEPSRKPSVMFIGALVKVIIVHATK